MKRTFCFFLLLTGLSNGSFAQQKLDPGGMNYLYSPKPNSIIYHDTLFKGSEQFRQLFYRQHDPVLMKLYNKHQSNKIWGQTLGFVGTVATVIGISVVSSSDGNKGVGWAMAGGGFVTTLFGGYLTLMGQQNLQLAVTLFNQPSRKTVLGLGVAHNKAGLAYNF
jgi:hypothetical protein